MKHIETYESYVEKEINEGILPKINITRISDLAGKSPSQTDKRSITTNVGKWFNDFGGTLISDPDKWKSEYRSRLPSYTTMMADGSYRKITGDAGFSGLVGTLASATKGVLGKVFGGPKKEVQPKEKPAFVTPEHQRIFMSNTGNTVSRIPNKDAFNKWASTQYKKMGINPGENPAFDEAVQASYLKWLDTTAGKLGLGKPNT